jgi:hypothetical protein
LYGRNTRLFPIRSGPLKRFFAYDKLGSVAIIASAAGFIRTVLQILLPMHDPESFFLYNQAEHWHISCDTNSTGVRFKSKEKTSSRRHNA